MQHFLMQPGQAVNLAQAFFDSGRLDAAIGKLVGFLADQPDHARARGLLVRSYAQRGADRFNAGRYDDAIADQTRALELQPDFAEVITDLGASYERLGHFQEAIACHRQALALAPDLARAHYNLAHALLSLGDLAEGFREFEYRWRVPGAAKPTFSQPEWDGTPLNGRHLLVYAEQGLGDTFQFARYLPLISGGMVTFGLGQQPQLHEVLQGLCWSGALARDLPESFDLHVPLMSLPRLLGTRLETIPAASPYLVADQGLAAAWRQRIGGHGVRIGINWQGNPVGSVDIGRSFPLTVLSPLAAIPGIRLISLQKGHGLDQLDGLPPGMTVETLGERFDATGGAFVDTAAVMAGLDLIITSDTSVAHLAGALGRPTWILLKKTPDWRWLPERPDTPWYPTARLFRQHDAGDWDGVAARVAAAVAEFAAALAR